MHPDSESKPEDSVFQEAPTPSKSEEKSQESASPPQETTDASGETKASAVEVLTFDEEKFEEMSQGQGNSRNSWLPWKRPNRRDQQLRHLREGYIELLGLVRSISHHLDRQQNETSQVSTLVDSLPPALNSFEKLANSQQEVTAILGNLNSHLEKTSQKDEQLLQNIQGFNSALKEVSSSNLQSLGTLSQVSRRIENSDEQMKNIFEHATENSHASNALMVRLEKRVFLSNLALVVLLCLVLVVAMVWLTKERPTAAPTVITVPTPQAPVVPMPAPTANPEPRGESAILPEPQPTPLPSVEPSAEVVPAPVLPAPTIPANREGETPLLEGETPAKPDGPNESKETEETETEEFEDLNLFDF